MAVKFTPEEDSEIMALNKCIQDLAKALTDEGNATTPLIATANIDKMNELLLWHLNNLLEVVSAT